MLNEHELRAMVVSEMHLRRWPQVRPPASIVQFVRVLDPADREEELAAMRTLPSAGPSGARTARPRHLDGVLAPGIAFTWERHSEASTITLFVTGGAAAQPGLGDALAWAGSLPGKVIRASRVQLVADEAQALVLLPDLGFASGDLVTCHIGDGPPGMAGAARARIWSDFRLREDGFGLVLVAAGGMAPGALSRTLQRLQELGNYRNLALLGLPVAREGWRALDRIEAMLAETNRAVARPEITDDDLLEDVTRLSMELVAQASASDFRMSATAAYATIVEERLAELNIAAIPGEVSLADFTQRRFLPAVRTCAAHRRRAEQLSQRTAQALALLRVRIETRIENQNGLLLASMERSATRQLRLQQLVEGLSVVAVSYYALGLIAKILEGVEELAPRIHAHVATAVLAPAVLAGVWLAIHRMKRRILGPEEGK
ncbi:DUF3422 domain-containing protein [Novosphingobium resinovorum]|uniref:DUF3422 domain-containing protein n=1 Tax=Novosphingobium resinovorum TaxID=158500 RepID=UPI002ED5067E|nr:DUF3422 domain-containing protein [Novosphingobium resinovorum]